jgi:phosphoglycolate phosphatase
MIIVSACLAGYNCRYNGGSHNHEKVIQLVRKGRALPVCPEQLGGLTTPRNPAEIVESSRVMTQVGEDYTEQFHLGAMETLRLCKLYNCKEAILKSMSPSCGSNQIYDGSFSKTVIKGDGITAKLLKENGVKVITEEDMEDKKIILFDLDGTIIDPKEGITKSVEYALQSFGIEVEDRDTLTSFIGPPLRGSFKKYYGFTDEEAEIAIGKYRERFAPTGLYENILYEGIVDLFRELKLAGKKLIIATSKPTIYAQRILEHHKIQDYFSFVGGCELDGRRGEKDEVIKYVLEEMNVTSVEDTIMIGDREYDVLGANEVGMESIGVLYGYGDLEELTGAGATYIVESVGELAGLLGIE